MTLEEMEAAGRQAEAIHDAKKRLAAAREKMRLLEKHAKNGTQWTVTLRLKENDAYRYDGQVDVVVTIPFEVVQQSISYECQAARRKIIALGGMP